DASRVLPIRGIERSPRALGTDDRGPGDDGWQGASLREQGCRAHLDGVDDGDGGDRRTRTDRRVDAIDEAERVGGRRAQVDDEVGLVGEPATDRVVGRVDPSVRDGGYRD